MRAVKIGEDRQLRVEEIAGPEPGEGDVLLDVSHCGICGSDIHLRPSEMVPAGAVMGHEFSGRIVELGASVEGWQPGERVCVIPFEPCGECAMCRAGHEQVCVNAASGGMGLGQAQGAYAERIAVPAATLHRLPEGMSDEQGALVEPLAVGVHGVALADADPSEPAAVIGAGPIGAMTALALRARGFERVVVIERNERRAERMRELGFATAGAEGAAETVTEALGGELPAAIFECAGNPAALGLAIELVRPRGRIVALGVLEEPVEISQLMLILKEAQVLGSFAYSRADFAEAVEMLADGRTNADALVTDVVPLERAQEMFDELVRPGTEQLKVLLRP